MNYDALNRYVLAAIGCFGVALYIVFLWVGWTEINARLEKRTPTGKRASSGRRVRRHHKTKDRARAGLK